MDEGGGEGIVVEAGLVAGGIVLIVGLELPEAVDEAVGVRADVGRGDAIARSR
jgi:hypothetical protein